MIGAALERKIPLPALAKAWGWSQRTLYRLVKLKAIPNVRIGGRIFFEESELDAWVAVRRQAEQATERLHETLHHAETVERRIRQRGHQRSREEECAALGIPVDHEFS